MRYKNGTDLFPQELLKEIQKYVSGGLIYIPQVEDQRKSWGEVSGIKAEMLIRNSEIKQKFQDGLTIIELAEEYWLSIETIKRIVYTNKE